MPDKYDDFLDAGDDRLDAFLDAPLEAKPITFREKFTEAAKAAAQQHPLGQAVRAAKGFVKGLPRLETGLETGFEKAGVVAGKLAPGLAGSLAAGTLTGGAGFIPAVTAQALGAGAGEAFGQLGARAAGGQAPATSLEAALDIGKAAGSAGGGEAVVGGILRAGKALLPKAAKTFGGVPGRAIERGMKRPQTATGKGGTAESVESEGVAVLQRIQGKAEAVRERLGKRVESALNKLHLRTQGAPIVDMAPVAKAADDVLTEAVNNPVTGGLVVKSEVKAIQDVLSRIRNLTGQALSVRDAVNSRRALDDLTGFVRGGVPRVSSDVGKRAVRAARDALRDSIENAARKAGDTSAILANRSFSRFARFYDDELVPLFGTKTGSRDEIARRFKSIVTRFNDPGMRSALIEQVGKSGVLGASKDVAKLLDLAASRAFVAEAAFTPSGVSMAALRTVLSPAGVGSIIRGLPTAQKAAAPGTFTLAQIIEDQVRRMNQEQTGGR